MTNGGSADYLRTHIPMPNDTAQEGGYEFTVHALPYEGEGIGQELAEKLTVVSARTYMLSTPPK